MATTSTETSQTSLVDIFVARQPIFDSRGKIYAYELLYRRNGAILHADGSSADTMAAEVLVQAFLNIGIEQITGGAKAFLNFTREMLLRGVHQLFDPKDVVIELLESVPADDEVVAACTALVHAGYTLALDDFVYDVSYEPLLRLASIVKVDVLNGTRAGLAEMAARLRPFDVEVLAERVETLEMRDTCASLGYVYFQGYFFSRPEVLAKRDLSAAQLTILRLMNLLRDTNSNDAVIEDAFKGDLSLMYKLLRVVNSASVGGRGIESIRHAVRLVGRAELHKWLSLLLVTSVAGQGGINEELVQTAILRARMCELVALDRGDRRGAEALFMVGLFSLLDAIMKTSMTELLDRIDLATEVRRALLIRSGPFAPTLALVEAWERGAWDAASGEAESLGMDPSLIGALYLSALSWTRERLDSSAADG